MSMFARFDDVIHPTQAWELADECTACGNTGFVAYPVTVMPEVLELDPCPYGCPPLSEDELVDMRNPDEGRIPEDLVDAWFASRKPENYTDPFLTLMKQHRQGVRISIPMRRNANFGRITASIPLKGLLLDTDRRVYPCTVPAYLAGSIIDLSEDTVDVRYEYFGSFVTVRYSHRLVADWCRFAYSWDVSYNTADLL